MWKIESQYSNARKKPDNFSVEKVFTTKKTSNRSLDRSNEACRCGCQTRMGLNVEKIIENSYLGKFGLSAF